MRRRISVPEPDRVSVPEPAPERVWEPARLPTSVPERDPASVLEPGPERAWGPALERMPAPGPAVPRAPRPAPESKPVLQAREPQAPELPVSAARPLAELEPAQVPAVAQVRVPAVELVRVAEPPAAVAERVEAAEQADQRPPHSCAPVADGGLSRTSPRSAADAPACTLRFGWQKRWPNQISPAADAPSVGGPRRSDCGGD